MGGVRLLAWGRIYGRPSVALPPKCGFGCAAALSRSTLWQEMVHLQEGTIEMLEKRVKRHRPLCAQGGTLHLGYSTRYLHPFGSQLVSREQA